MAKISAARSDRSSILIADIGGTFARFAVVGRTGRPDRPMTLRVAEFPDPVAAAQRYLESANPPHRPRRAILAVAAPIVGRRIAMTNHPWRFTLDAIARGLALDKVEAINDFQAIALSIPRLGARDLRKIGGGRAQAGAPIAVLGAGTGLGVSAFVPTPAGPIALATEGGHATLAAVDSEEAEVLEQLRFRLGHVSAERVLSGAGLAGLYRIFAAQHGRGSPASSRPSPARVIAQVSDGTCPIAAEAFRLFAGFLGGFAGNLALTLGARGGVYLAGGILPRVADELARSLFRARFEAKGRFRPYLAAIPTHLIIRPDPALIGLAACAVTR